MTGFSMISLPINLAELRRQSAIQGLIDDEGRALHHFLSETFGKGAIQPFRLMPGRRGAGHATLYGYTTVAELALQKAAETAAPELEALLQPSCLSFKTMPQIWTSGRRLSFDVRIRPVRRLRKPIGNFRKVGAEIDAWFLASLNVHPDGPPRERADRLRRDDVYVDWLAERLEGAAYLHSVRLARFERTGSRRNGMSPGPDATLHGELAITDGSLFARKLSRGIGRHKAYGYGMLLLRPPGKF